MARNIKADYEAMANHSTSTDHNSEGKFFQVKSKGTIRTIWGETKEELSEHLNKIRSHFDSITELV